MFQNSFFESEVRQLPPAQVNHKNFQLFQTRQPTITLTSISTHYPLYQTCSISFFICFFMCGILIVSIPKSVRTSTFLPINFPRNSPKPQQFFNVAFAPLCTISISLFSLRFTSHNRTKYPHPPYFKFPYLSENLPLSYTNLRIFPVFSITEISLGVFLTAQ